jgi:hypothetical protein
VILPTLEELLALRAPARTLTLSGRLPAQALLLGSHRSAHHGRGLEIEEVRPYVAGDDPRHIDWRVTARRGRAHTKLFREERERPVWLFVDLGASMFFGSRSQLKSTVGVRAAALLAWAAGLAGDRVGAIVGNGQMIRVLPARTRQSGVLPILNALIELQPRRPEASADRKADLVDTLLPLVHPGSLILALSDFGKTSTQTEVAWSALAVHSDCRWLWITDALEVQGLPNGRFLAGFGGKLSVIDGAGARSAWLGSWAERESLIRAFTSAHRIGLTQMDTAQDIIETLAASIQWPRVAA